MLFDIDTILFHRNPHFFLNCILSVMTGKLRNAGSRQKGEKGNDKAQRTNEMQVSPRRRKDAETFTSKPSIKELTDDSGSECIFHRKDARAQRYRGHI